MPLSKAMKQQLGIANMPLHQIPQKEKGAEMPSTNVYVKNGVHQADLIFLPEDRGYKYALVVVDLRLPDLHWH